MTTPLAQTPILDATWYAVRYHSKTRPDGVLYAYGARHVAHCRAAILQSGWDLVGIERCSHQEATQ